MAISRYTLDIAAVDASPRPILGSQAPIAGCRAASCQRDGCRTVLVLKHKAESKDLQEENDLLLAQLHQVQEELERYYLMNKDLGSSVSDVTVSLRNARYLLMNSNLPAARGKQKLLPRL